MRSISSRLRGALETRAASARYQRSIAAALAIGSLVLALPARPVRAEADGPDFYRVTGVAADDVLNIRSGPSAKDAVVGTVPPNGDAQSWLQGRDELRRVGEGVGAQARDG